MLATLKARRPRWNWCLPCLAAWWPSIRRCPMRRRQSTKTPYGKGWIAELELRDFAADRELLIDGPAYAEIITKKAAEYA